MAGNPVLGFLSVQPTGDGPHATVTKMLRLLGIVVLVWFAVSTLGNILQLTLGDSYYDGVAPGLLSAGAVAASAIIGIVIAAAITAAVLFWITFTINAWTNNDPRGSTHALILAIIAVVLGGLGALGLLGALAVTGYPLYMMMVILGGLVGLAELYCGIMILTNRGKATAGAGNPRMGAAN